MPRIVPSLDTAPRDSLRYLLSAALVIAGLYVGSEIFVPIALAVLLSFVLAPASGSCGAAASAGCCPCWS